MIKVLQTSDIHFGSFDPHTYCTNDERLTTFKKIIELAKEHDLFIIAGDLFSASEEIKTLFPAIKASFQQLKNSKTTTIICPSKAESNDSTLLTYINDLNPDIIISDSEDNDPHHFKLENEELYLYSIPTFDNNSLLSRKKIEDKELNGFHMGILHTPDHDILENLTQPESELNEKNFKIPLDFYAIGGNHTFKLTKIENQVIGASAGTPEAVSHNETGDRYILSFSIKENKIKQITRLTVNTVKHYQESMECTLQTTKDELISKLKKHSSSESVYTLLLTGERDFSLKLANYQKLTSDYRKLKIIDKTTPSIKALINEQCDEESFKGLFFKLLEKILENQRKVNPSSEETLLNLLNLIIRNELTEETLCKLLNA